MKSIEIIHPGISSSIQDGGRVGYAFYAIPRSGVMDYQAYESIKSLLGLSEYCTVIECTLQAPKIQFNEVFTIVISGADMHWKINGNPVELDTVVRVRQGDLLTGGFAQSGFRGYIGFADEMKVTRHYKSASAYSYASLGANNGQALNKGQRIQFTEKKHPTPTESLKPKRKNNQAIIIHKGPEYDWIVKAKKSVLISNEFRISPQSNRMGARLLGPEINVKQHMTSSVPVLPGFIQLLPSGQLIVLLQDGQTTGGYPRIAYLDIEALSAFNQVAIGKSVRFELE